MDGYILERDNLFIFYTELQTSLFEVVATPETFKALRVCQRMAEMLCSGNIPSNRIIQTIHQRREMRARRAMGAMPVASEEVISISSEDEASQPARLPTPKPKRGRPPKRQLATRPDSSPASSSSSSSVGPKRPKRPRQTNLPQESLTGADRVNTWFMENMVPTAPEGPSTAAPAQEAPTFRRPHLEGYSSMGAAPMPRPSPRRVLDQMMASNCTSTRPNTPPPPPPPPTPTPHPPPSSPPSSSPSSPPSRSAFAAIQEELFLRTPSPPCFSPPPPLCYSPITYRPVSPSFSPIPYTPPSSEDDEPLVTSTNHFNLDELFGDVTGDSSSSIPLPYEEEVMAVAGMLGDAFERPHPLNGEAAIEEETLEEGDIAEAVEGLFKLFEGE